MSTTSAHHLHQHHDSVFSGGVGGGASATSSGLGLHALPGTSNTLTHFVVNSNHHQHISINNNHLVNNINDSNNSSIVANNNNNATTSNGIQQRSTRGASKQRRDQINVEIQKLRDLLPLSDLIKDRLFQLQVMSLGCIFIRKHRYQQTVLQQMHLTPPLPRGIDICKALRGFMLMMTRSGKILHVSDNASEYLGHSVEEIMCQGDSIYDLVDIRDHGAVQAELASGPPNLANFPEERVFICRLNLARTAKRQLQYHKFVLIQGRYIQPAEVYQSIAAQTSQSECDHPVFSSFCQPLINPENAESMSNGNTNIFATQHFLDMRFKESDSMACHHLGFSKQEMRGMSWYGMLHPSHILEVSYKHRLLCQEKEGSVLALIRLQTINGNWIWLHTVFSIRPSNEINSDGKRTRHVIHCFHQKLSNLEAATLQANSWIYSMRHTYPTVFSCQDSSSDERPVSPITPPYKEEQKPMIIPQIVQQQQQPQMVDFNQIKVEIPMRVTNTQIPMYTPESSSPESSASLHTSLVSQAYQPIVLEDIMPSGDEVLPELKDEVDEILRQVEQCDAFQRPSNVNLGHRHSVPSVCSNSELYKYLGPALFEEQQPPMSCPPSNNNNNPNPYFLSHFQQPNFQHFDHYNRKRSWAM